MRDGHAQFAFDRVDLIRSNAHAARGSRRGSLLSMAEAKASENISRQALLQRDFSTLTNAAAGYIFCADKFAQQPHAFAERVAGFDSAFASALVDDGGGIIEILVSAAEVGLALELFAIVLDFKPVSHADPLNLMLGAGKFCAERSLALQLDVRGKSKQAVGVLRVSIVHEGPAHLKETIELDLRHSTANPESRATLIDFVSHADGDRVQIGIERGQRRLQQQLAGKRLELVIGKAR